MIPKSFYGIGFAWVCNLFYSSEKSNCFNVEGPTVTSSAVFNWLLKLFSYYFIVFFFENILLKETSISAELPLRFQWIFRQLFCFLRGSWVCVIKKSWACESGNLAVIGLKLVETCWFFAINLRTVFQLQKRAPSVYCWKTSTPVSPAT